jgi:hypothetical protein
MRKNLAGQPWDKPGHDDESDAAANGFLSGAKRRGNLCRSAYLDGDCFAALAMTAMDARRPT